MAYLAIILGILALVLIHEAGHFIAARMVGIRATKFYVGFPPSIWSFRRGETEYGIGLTLLGGYVKMPGMFRPTGSELHDRLEPSLTDVARGLTNADHRLHLQANLRRIGRASSADLLLSELTELHELLGELTVADGDHRLRQRIAAAVTTMIDDCHPRAYWRADLWRRMVVIAAGPLANILTAIALLFVLAWVFTPRFEGTWIVSATEPGSPAEQAGISPGSEIVTWGGVSADDDQFGDTIARYRGKPVEVTFRPPAYGAYRSEGFPDGGPGEIYQRDAGTGEPQTEQISPADLGDDTGKRIGINGFSMQDVERSGFHRNSPGDAANETWFQTRSIISGMVTGIGGLVVRPETRDDVRSIVGIVDEAPEVQEAGRLWFYLAFLSLAIAVFNLLPLLPLDGGHLAFGLIEAIRRRPLPRVAYEQASMIGLGLIGVLFFIGLSNDLGGGA